MNHVRLSANGAGSGLRVDEFADSRGNRLAIGTLAPQGTGEIALGANRIVPQALETRPGFDLRGMATDLARQMATKIGWMRRSGMSFLCGMGEMRRYHGSKCVGLPARGSDGEILDLDAFLDFQLTAFRRYEAETGTSILTGQDLGHTPYTMRRMRASFPGFIDTDTSYATALGVFHISKGLLETLGIDAADAQVGIVGMGKIGTHLARRFQECGTRVVGLECDRDRFPSLRRELPGELRLFDAESAADFHAQPMDAVLACANKSSFSRSALRRIAANRRIRILSGAENLAVESSAQMERWERTGRVYCPTELAGLMGALTAAAEYDARDRQVDLTRLERSWIEPIAERLESWGREFSFRRLLEESRPDPVGSLEEIPC